MMGFPLVTPQPYAPLALVGSGQLGDAERLSRVAGGGCGRARIALRLSLVIGAQL